MKIPFQQFLLYIILYDIIKIINFSSLYAKLLFTFLTMSLPLVSVVIPAYNHEKYITEAINSVIYQDYPRLEIIVIDDGSQDNTYNKAESCLKNCQRPYKLEYQTNRGAPATLNYGCSIAQGDYIAILNSDDLFHPQRISIMIRILQEYGYRFAFSKVRHIDENGFLHPYQEYYHKLLTKAERFPSMSFALLLDNLAITTGNFVIEHNFFEEVGPFAPFVTCHDWDYILRVVLNEEPFYYPQELMDYRIHPKNTLKDNVKLVYQEGIEVRRLYLEKAKEAKNVLAPGPSTWGSYWNFFVDHYLIPSCASIDPTIVSLHPIYSSENNQYDTITFTRLVKSLGQHVIWNETLEGKVEEFEKIIKALEEKIAQSSTEISLLKNNIENLERAPLYYAIRKQLLPLFKFLGGDRSRILVRLKMLLRRIFNLRCY